MSCVPPGSSKGIHAPTTCLLVVAMLWATYGVSMRLIYADPGMCITFMLVRISAGFEQIICITHGSVQMPRLLQC